MTAGNGGDGAITFYRDREIMYGAGDGGDGGKGGDVIFKANKMFKDLRIVKNFQV